MFEENDENISALREEIKKDFSPITPIIYTVLETAQSVVPECIELFNERCGNDSPDAGKVYRLLHPSLMRAIMQILLNSKNLKTKAVIDHDNYDIKADWERIILSNNGLAGKYADRNYRLLKALRSETIGNILPPPGQSRKKSNYYCNSHLQQFRMPLYPSEGGCELPKHNVIYLWDNPTANSVSLYLVCPKWGRGNKAVAYFIDPIEHPALSIRPPVEPDEIVRELDLEKLRDDINIVLNGDTQDESNENDLREQN